MPPLIVVHTEAERLFGLGLMGRVAAAVTRENRNRSD